MNQFEDKCQHFIQERRPEVGPLVFTNARTFINARGLSVYERIYQGKEEVRLAFVEQTAGHQIVSLMENTFGTDSSILFRQRPRHGTAKILGNLRFNYITSPSPEEAGTLSCRNLHRSLNVYQV